MSFHPQTQLSHLNVSSWEWKYFLLTSSSPPASSPSPHFPSRFSIFKRQAEWEGYLAAPFQILILQTFNFTAADMSKKKKKKKVLCENERKREIATSPHQRAQQGRRRREKVGAGEEPNYPCGEADHGGSGAPGPACSALDNPPMSSLCVNQSFICHSEEKTAAAQATTTTTCSQKEPRAHRRRRELGESGSHGDDWYVTHRLKGNGEVWNTNKHRGFHHKHSTQGGGV